MSDKPKFPREQALAVANNLVKLLAPFTQRIEIVGSLRRGKALVSDAEILFVPATQTSPDGLFDTLTVDLADAYIDSLFKSGLVGKRLNSAGYVAAWGPKNKLAVHTTSGIPVDFFATTEENWWTSLVIRTGSLETNLKLTTGAQKLNRTLHAYGSGVTVNGTGMAIPAESERDVFKLCGVGFLDPKDR